MNRFLTRQFVCTLPILKTTDVFCQVVKLHYSVRGYLINISSVMSYACMNSISMQSTLASKMSGRKAFAGTSVSSAGHVLPARQQARRVCPQALFTKNKTKNEVRLCHRFVVFHTMILFCRLHSVSCYAWICTSFFYHARTVWVAEKVAHRQERQRSRPVGTRIHP